MSAAAESHRMVEVGDFVFVHPHDDLAPADVRGRDGTVVALRGTKAQLELGSDDQLLWIDAGVLRLNRRRKRRRVSWD